MITPYAATLVMVALATGLGFIVRELVAAPNLTLVFVLPVIVAATAFGWGPAVLASVAGVAAFDFFFTQPFYSFRIASPSDLWAAALLLLIAAIVSALATQSRRRALEAERAAKRAAALQVLAHAVIEAQPRSRVVAQAAEALHAAFQAPAVILVEDGETLLASTAGEAEVTEALREAARGALDAQVHIAGGVYPYEASDFDLWPFTPAGAPRCVLGVDLSRADGDRPRSPAQLVEVVAGYLAAALAKGAPAAA